MLTMIPVLKSVIWPIIPQPQLRLRRQRQRSLVWSPESLTRSLERDLKVDAASTADRHRNSRRLSKQAGSHEETLLNSLRCEYRRLGSRTSQTSTHEFTCTARFPERLIGGVSDQLVYRRYR